MSGAVRSVWDGDVRWVRTAIALAAVCAGTALLGPPAARAGSWGPAQQLSVTASGAPQALFTARGEGVVMSGPPTFGYDWGPSGPAPTGSASDALVRVAVKEPGAQFGPAQVISAPGATLFSMFADPDGSVVGEWIDQNGLERATRPPFGRFGAPTTLVPAAELAAAGPGAPTTGADSSTEPLAEMSVDEGGDLLLVWRTVTPDPANGESTVNVMAQFRPVGGQFGAPTLAFSGQENTNVTFGSALDAGGNAYVAVTGIPAGSSSTNTGAYIIERPAGGSFFAPALLSDPGESVRSYLNSAASGPQPFTVDPAGDLAFAWDATPPGGSGGLQVRAAVRAHGVWFATQTLWQQAGNSPPGFAFPSYVSAAWGPAGQLGVAWINGQTFQFALRPPGGAFGVPESIPGTPAGNWAVNFGFDSLGDTAALPIVTYPWLVNVDGIVAASVRAPGGTFQAATPLAPTQNGTAGLSFDSFGDGIVAWAGLAAGVHVTYAAYYDAAPPVVTQLVLGSAHAARVALATRVAPATRRRLPTRPRPPTRVGLRFSKPGILGLVLTRIACRRVTQHHHRRTVCADQAVSHLTQVVAAGPSAIALRRVMIRALGTRGKYRMTAQETDGPGRTGLPLSTTITVR